MKVGDTISVKFAHNTTNQYYRDVLLVYEDELGLLWGITDLLGSKELVQVWNSGGVPLGDYVGNVDELWTIIKLIKGV